MKKTPGIPVTTLRAGLLAFLVAAVTLFSQVLIHRSVSAKLLNNYAFLVISLTMLGFALSGVILTRWLEPFLAKLQDVLTTCAALFVLSLLGASALFYHAPASLVALTGRFDFVVAYLKSIPLALLYAVPFTFCGLMLGLLLSARQFPTRRVYFFDLAGSAVGAFAVLPAITHLGVEGGLLLAAGAMLLGTLLLAPPRRTGSRVVAAVAGLALLGATGARETVFDLNYPKGSMLASFEDLPAPYGIEYVTWDPIARIELSRIPPPDPEDIGYPSLIGGNPGFHQRLTRILTQNNFAFTFAVDYDGERASLDGIDETIYAAAYQATSVDRPKVAIAGVGGGIDVLTALYFDASEVTGVEINAATVELVTETYRDDFKSWSEDPRVKLVVAEGRSFLSTTDQQFDVLQLSGVDSYSGTSAVAHVFSENYLYTGEAWDTYLERLTPAGIVCMMRLEHKPPKEMLRALITAVAALRRAGIAHPAAHVMMLTQSDGAFTALLVKKTPFNSEERQRLGTWAGGHPHFEVSASPALNPTKANFYQLFLSLDDARLEELFARAHPFDVRPTTDDWPFPFKYSYWSHLFSSDPVVQGSMPVMQYSVVLLTVLIGAIACLCIFLPLWRLASSGLRSPGSLRYGFFFAGTGLGYLAIEMALLQKFSLFLGHPNYALSVVLAVLLVSTGLGSLYSERIVGALGGVRFVSYALAFLVLVEVLVLLPRLPSLIGLPFWVKTAVTFALVLPLGLCLGVFVPTALERLKVASPAYVPWAWGINGIFSVLAPVLSVALSMTAGISALMLAAVPVYLAVGLALPAVRTAR